MAVYIAVDARVNEKHRHLDLWCVAHGSNTHYLGHQHHENLRSGTRPTWEAGERTVIYVANTRRVQADTERCPKCFFEGAALPASLEWPDWKQAIALLPAVGVYELSDPTRRNAQIGSGQLHSRLSRRIDATHKGRFVVADSVWWLYDLLIERTQPDVRALEVQPDETPLQAEVRWREQRRFDGWQVTSNV